MSALIVVVQILIPVNDVAFDRACAGILRREGPAMAQKAKPKAKGPAAAKSSPATKRSPTARLEAANAALIKQLAAAEARIAALEQQRDDALNRIEWVIDSLNSLAESVR
jgi:hypothetical protein